MDFTVNRIRGLRAWRRGLLAALVALLLAACGGTSAQGGGGAPTLNWYISPEYSGSFVAAAKDSSLDILGLDVVWEAEFDEAGWIVPFTGERRRQAEQDAAKAALDTPPGRAAGGGAVQQQHPAAVVPQGPGAPPADDLGRDAQPVRPWPARASPTTSRSRAPPMRATPSG